MGFPEHASPPDMYVEQNTWPASPQQQHPQDYTLIRCVTFPYPRPEDDVRPPGHTLADVQLEDMMPHGYHPPHSQFYGGPPAHHPHIHHTAHPEMHLGMHGGHGLAQHSLPMQHTDDAASKETQYLRRRCFNCRTTEPPSWRRSTLSPGKIVCNKCGLYERTHLRACPLKFDQLRTGNKAGKGGKGLGSPKAGSQNGVKKGGAIARRSSVTSTGSSAQSRSGVRDWVDR
ncbi:hypothetical protein B0H14DRAFT_2856779, partial [Mycena olivaceomarginata]